jgi:hypothetical protein
MREGFARDLRALFRLGEGECARRKLGASRGLIFEP